MKAFDTITEALNDLKKRGYTIDFNLQFDNIFCEHTNTRFKPSEFEIVEVHRFEGQTDPADEAVVYAIEAKDGRKGVLVEAYGPYANEVSEEMLRKLKIHHH